MKLGETGAVTAEPEVPQDSVALALAPQSTFTARSRKSIRTEQALVKELARRNALKGRVRDSLDTLEREKKMLLKLITDGDAWADNALSDTLSKIDTEERKLTVFTEEAIEAQADLDNFRASIEACVLERSRVQGNLADLAVARLELDGEIERLLRAALAILEVRGQIVNLMREQAAAIELPGSFEAGVPASLHEALSLEIVSASSAWNSQFLGEEKHLKPYIVSGESFEPEIETLSRKAVYSFGETVYLLEEEASAFLRNDRPQPGRGGETFAPTLMTAEAFTAAAAEAGTSGPMLRYYLQKKHSELEQLRFEANKLERRGTPVPGAHLGGAH